MEKQKITVSVAGKNYTLVSNDPPEFVRRVAAFVDRKLSETAAVTNLPSGQAAVLTCFNLLDQNNKAESSADHIRGQLTEYLQDAARARIELEDANREIARLRAELDRAYHR